MRAQTIVTLLASTCDARLRCTKHLDTHKEWYDRHEDTIESIVSDFLPHGSGIDSGVKFNFEHSTGEKLVLDTAFHHMDENGYYDGWSNHTITVRPSLRFGFTLSISGRNRNDIKDYLSDVFHADLSQTIEWDESKQTYVRTEVK